MTNIYHIVQFQSGDAYVLFYMVVIGAVLIVYGRLKNGICVFQTI